MLEDLADYMASQGVGIIEGGDASLFEDFMPDKPDNAVMIKDTGGSKPDVYLPTREPTFQVLVRNKDYSAGKAVAESIRTLLHRSANLTCGSTHFYFIALTAEGGHIGRDDEGREVFSLNFQARVRAA